MTDRLDALEARLDELEAREAIHDLMSAYAWAMDCGDADGVAATFTPDGVLREDVFAEPVRHTGREGVRTWARHHFSHPDFAGRQHYVGHVRIEGSGDERTVRSFAFVTKCSGPPPYVLRFLGSYEDTVVRQDGAWLFARRIIRLWTGEHLALFPNHHTHLLDPNPDFAAIDGTD